MTNQKYAFTHSLSTEFHKNNYYKFENWTKRLIKFIDKNSY